MLLLRAMLLVLSFTAGLGWVSAQDLNNLADARWNTTGGFGVSLSAYNRSGTGLGRSSPFAYVLSGNLTLSYGDIAIPVSVTYRDQQGSISNPFQRFGLSPTYKWATVHLGWRSVPLGRYLYAGQDFLGVGVELSPGKFRFAALRGRLRSPLVQRDSLYVGAELYETYRRVLTGARVGVGTEANHFDVLAIRVRDEVDGSSEAPESRAFGFRPADNVGFGTQLQLRFGRYVTFGGESSISAVTNDRQRDSLDVDNRLVEAVAKLIDVNETTRAHFAHDYRAGITLGGVRMGVDFQQIDPFYRSLGTPYLLNDIRRINGRVGFALGGGKVRVETRLGRQRNNLNGLLQTTNARWIGSLSVETRLSRELMLQARYYNFQSQLEDGLVVVDDTLRRGQQTATYSLGPSFRRRLTGKTLFVRAALDYRDIAYQQARGPRQSTQQQSALLSGGQEWEESGLGLQANLRWQRQADADGFRQNTNAGLGLQASKTLLDKRLRLSLSGQFTRRTRDKLADGAVTSASVDASMRTTERSTLALRLNMLNSNSPVATRDFSELRSHLSYRISF